MSNYYKIAILDDEKFALNIISASIENFFEEKGILTKISKYTHPLFLKEDFNEKEFGRVGNIIVCLIATIVIFVLMFIIALLFACFGLKINAIGDVLFVSIFLCPSFIVVIIIVALFLSGVWKRKLWKVL